MEIADVARRSQAEAVYDLLKQDVIRCALMPGQQVTEEQLAARYGVGRSAVRPVLKRLYQEHLIETISRQRYIIAPITIQDAKDLYETRVLLEPAAAQRAAGRLTPEQVRQLQELAQASYHLGVEGEVAEFLEANTSLHKIIAGASGNRVMSEVISLLLDRVERFNHLSHLILNRSDTVRHEHEELVEALAGGDGERAAELMEAHIRSARSFLIEVMIESPSVRSVNVVAAG